MPQSNEPQNLTSISARLKTANPTTEILAVSKFQPVEKIRELYIQGQRQFAENYAQEAIDKQIQLQDLKDLVWHFIGHLQKNKVKMIVGKFSLIHSVDSLELAQTIDRKAGERQIIQDILVQLNLAEEETKGGFNENDFAQQAAELAKLKSIRVKGLMTMPPLFENPEMARPFFKKLSNMRDQFSSLLPDLKILSMGTSSDYLVAAQEGASLVRLGTVLFGERPTKTK
jgi:hypothetical protein